MPPLSARTAWVVLVAAIWSAAGAAVDPFTALAYATVAGPVIVVVGVALRSGWHRRQLPSQSEPGGATGGEVGDGGTAPSGTWAEHRLAGVVWVVLWFAVIFWQIMVFTSSPREAYPTFSSLLNDAMEPYPVRVAVWGFWLYLGWYVVRR
jgi:hypothetical protein